MCQVRNTHRNLTSEFVTQVHSSVSLKLDSTFKKFSRFLLTRHSLIFTRVKLECLVRSFFVACKCYFGAFSLLKQKILSQNSCKSSSKVLKLTNTTQIIRWRQLSVILKMENYLFTASHSSALECSLKLHSTFRKILIFSLTRHSHFTRNQSKTMTLDTLKFTQK